jgi:type II secretory pathway pseudopilin PulG
VNERGLSLLEALLALALLGVVLTALLAAFVVMMDTNTRDDERTLALAAAQGILEERRRAEIASLPTSGSSGIALVTVGNREFEVVEHYCTRAEYCGDETRHVLVEVSYGGRPIVDVASVFTELR